MGLGYPDDEEYLTTHVTTWPGPPVTCVVCLAVGAPYRDADDRCWRLPVHGWASSVAAGRPCPGSLTVVTAPPVPASMEARIETNMVAAMPPEYGQEGERAP